jgi:zinc transporter 9
MINIFFFQINLKVIPKLSKDRPKIESKSTTSRNFITPIRAMNEYLLKPNDLIDLRKFQRRSPYANEPPITVYLRKDIEAKYLFLINSFIDNLKKFN